MPHSNGLIPGTGLRTRSPITNARDVSRKYDGTSISGKVLTDLKSTAIAKVTGPGSGLVIDLPGAGPVVGVSHILAFTTATGTLLALPEEGVDFEVILSGPNDSHDAQLRELASSDRSAQTWLVHYQPDAEDIDIPANAASTITP